VPAASGAETDSQKQTKRKHFSPLPNGGNLTEQAREPFFVDIEFFVAPDLA
jgi:hypothetical protein